ncbi:MAG: hypothetical protein KKC14_02605 [Alphaproteobacteria bacterium]|nr:hypothetical protein [Alphaproteobacteria bacterium]
MKSRLDHLRTPRNALLALSLWIRPAFAQTPPPAPLELRLADVGRFASFVDLTSAQPEGEALQIRVLQVAEADFQAAGEAYWGGWRHEIVDCPARTLAHAGFSSLRATGREGPLMGDRRPAGVPASGGTDDAVLRVVCDGWKPFATVPVATSVEQAVRIGRPLIETGAEP